MELLKKEEVEVKEVTYTLQDETGVLYYKEWLDKEDNVIDSTLRSKDGHSLDDEAVLVESVLNFLELND